MDLVHFSIGAFKLVLDRTAFRLMVSRTCKNCILEAMAFD